MEDKKSENRKGEKMRMKQKILKSQGKCKCEKKNRFRIN